MPKTIKISRSAIKQTLKETPIDQILVGVHNAEKVNLTKKQKDFARKVAEGKPKAQAYREVYEGNATKKTQAEAGCRLAANSKVAAMIDAFQVANEAREYLIPQQIRALAVEKLVSIAINDGEKTSDKLRALELIGKMSEVSLFTERKDIVHHHNAKDIKTQLLEGLKQAFQNSRQVNELAKRKAESLLVELSDCNTVTVSSNTVTGEDPDPLTKAESESPLHPDPLFSTFADSEGLHSIPHTLPPNYNNVTDAPHNQSPNYNNVTGNLPTYNTVTGGELNSNTVTVPNYNNVTVNSNTVTVGEGVVKTEPAKSESTQETPPVNISNENG